MYSYSYSFPQQSISSAIQLKALHWYLYDFYSILIICIQLQHYLKLFMCIWGLFFQKLLYPTFF